MKTAVGLGFVASGVILIYGGITGRLAPMLAALFAPANLKDAPSKSIPDKVVGGILGTGLNTLPPPIGNAIEGVIPHVHIPFS